MPTLLWPVGLGVACACEKWCCALLHFHRAACSWLRVGGGHPASSCRLLVLGDRLCGQCCPRLLHCIKAGGCVLSALLFLLVVSVVVCFMFVPVDCLTRLDAAKHYQLLRQLVAVK